LNKAKTVAWFSLGIAAAGAVVAHLLPPSTGAGLLGAASDAALAGGLADLYAVTALFRHPLGLKIPHTAILPQSRIELARAAKGLVMEDWLTKEAILDKLRTVDIVGAIVKMARAHQMALASGIASMLVGVVSQIDIEAVAARLVSPLSSMIRDVDFERWVERALQWAVHRGYHEQLLDVALAEITPAMRTTEAREIAEGLLRDIVSGLQQSPKLAKFSMFLTPLLGMLDYAAISQQILFVLAEQIEQIRFEPSNIYRKRLLDGLERLPSYADRLAPQVRSLIDEWVEGDGFQSGLTEVLKKIKVFALAEFGTTGESSHLERMISRLLAEELDHLQSDESRRTAVDEWLRIQLASIVDRNHEMLGVLVEESLTKLSDDLLVETIEAKVGHHLQWIRVNGAIVGGLVGVVIYGISRAVG